jgi:cytochrome P450
MVAVSLPSGPRGHWLGGSLPDFRRDPLDFLTRCAREYGDFVPMGFGPSRVIFLNNPDYTEDVLVTNHRNFIKGPALRMNRQLLGNGLVTSEGDFWLHQRKLVQPAFHRDRIAAYAEIMVSYAERLTDSWQDGETRDVHAEMMHLTLDIVARTLFDTDVAGEAREVGQAMEAALQSFVSRTTGPFPLPEWVPTAANLRLRRATRTLDRIVYRIVDQRRRVNGTGDHEQKTLLDSLLQARDDQGNPMTDLQLRDEVMTLFLAGHETTAIALSWTWYLLALHSEVVDRLLTELRRVLGGRPPTFADLPRLAYTDQVVKESLRLYPPAWALSREAIGDCEIGGHRVPARTPLVISQWVAHHDPRYFDRPDDFDPDRWSGDGARRLPKFAYFPFGGGPRHCIGSSFATAEASLILAAITHRYHLELVPGQRIVPSPSITLRPAGGVRMVLHKR